MSNGLPGLDKTRLLLFQRQEIFKLSVRERSVMQFDCVWLTPSAVLFALAFRFTISCRWLLKSAFNSSAHVANQSYGFSRSSESVLDGFRIISTFATNFFTTEICCWIKFSMMLSSSKMSLISLCSFPSGVMLSSGI